MPTTLSGAAQTHMAPCDPRCKKHAGQKVSRRVRISCSREIDVNLWRQTAIAMNGPPEPPPIASTSTAPSSQPVDLVALAMETLSPMPPRPELGSFGNPDKYEDTTMPTWNVPSSDGPFDYGDHNPMDLAEGDDDQNPGSSRLFDSEPDSKSDSRPPTPGSDAYFEQYEYSPSLTPVDYTSGSEADVDTDVEMYPHLDNLEPISPASSRPCSPHIGDVLGGAQSVEIPLVSDWVGSIQFNV